MVELSTASRLRLGRISKWGLGSFAPNGPEELVGRGKVVMLCGMRLRCPDFGWGRALAAALAIALASCGGGTTDSAPETPVAPPADDAAIQDAPADATAVAGQDEPSIPDVDFALGREWVEAMLEENDGKLEEIRTRLQSVRRELDRMDASVVRDDLDELKQSMGEILDRERKALGMIRDTAEEMQGTLKRPAQR